MHVALYLGYRLPSSTLSIKQQVLVNNLAAIIDKRQRRCGSVLTTGESTINILCDMMIGAPALSPQHYRPATSLRAPARPKSSPSVALVVCAFHANRLGLQHQSMNQRCHLRLRSVPRTFRACSLQHCQRPPCLHWSSLTAFLKNGNWC